ncbi:peptidase T [Stagnihabitans tardus]|uniref:Peptidase T n=1 Tax=Stagnihabitans tardus TaxID=2699202 RepID=A0AAE4Y9M0_9RHOB|nr:peptidase T [Stagnihabitans tardus]NBZ87647.1 peptidase T [Stagnihabitans tardus]
MSFAAELESRLTRYCAIDSQSDAGSATSPSTEVQFGMLRLLVAELREIGAEDVTLTDYGAVLATIPATAQGPTIAFLAHVDTAPQYKATGVKPRVHRGYNGGAITYPLNPDLVLSPETSPELAKKIGHTIVTASGDTLLGADDKAGVAIIMAAARQLLANPVPHGKIRIAFTPDEEIGRGVNPQLPRDLAADFAYTFDGGKVGEIEFESFSADGATVTITGVSAHPGYATGKMVNATTLAAKLLMALPQSRTPENTQDREGFIHVTDMAGGSSEVTIRLILRDFEREGLAAKGALLQDACARLQAEEPRAKISCEIKPQYRNMRYWLEKDMTPVTRALDAARALGLTPSTTPIRGGTDGSRLTEMGLPCPNLFTGMAEIHGPLEWVSIQDMEVATNLMLKIVSP